MFNPNKLAALVMRAKGNSRTMQQFANEIGIPPSTLSRIVRQKNKTPSADRLMIDIARCADPDSGVKLEELRKANGYSGYMSENLATEIMVDEIKNRLKLTDDEVKIDAKYRNRYILDILTSSEKYGDWGFEIKAYNNSVGMIWSQRQILEMMGLLYVNEDLKKMSLVVTNRHIYEQIKNNLIENVETPKVLSVIFLDINKRMVIEEFTTNGHVINWRGAEEYE